MDTAHLKAPSSHGLRRLSLQPNEIVIRMPEIVLETSAPLDPESAIRTIGVRHVDGGVEISGTRAIWRPWNGMRPGAHVFVVGELVSEEGERLSAGEEIPFFVVESKTSVPPDVAIEAMVRLRREGLRTVRLPIDQPATGKYVEFFKGTNQRTGEPVLLAADESGRPVDPEEFHDSIRRARAEKFGKLEERLHARLEQGDP